ncbi:aspartic proteinase 36-like [Argentina anserina]|uniref:aspartic proteinase 36-like n=1 Tax=Argentina anserina TaxID=57926 RepID=UPI0021765E33|nr:aspartic proteinase 36-like [Potentilla anserina]
MEPRGLGDRLGGLAALVMVVLAVLISALVFNVSGNLVFPVSHKFNGREGASLSKFKAHDDRRHARILKATQNAVDMVLGGNGHPTQDGLYFAKLGIGNPSNDYYLQVDTGSDIFWVNCAECGKDCPTSTKIQGVKLTLYDRNSSSTSEVVRCSDKFCTAYGEDHEMAKCNKPDDKCSYLIQYGDGSSTSGYFVKDEVQFQKASGNFETSTISAPIIFGCGTNQSGLLNNPNVAVSGLLGFGNANITLLSQLAAAGKVRNKFAHCLDNSKQGGGIWAIGEVVEPKIKYTSPMVPNSLHYNLVLEKIEVGSDVVKLPTSGGGGGDVSDGSSYQNEAIFDSGTTLTLFPPELQEQIVDKILSKEPGLQLYKTQHDEFTCFDYSKNIDEKFPIVKFTFKNSASLMVYPHDYLFQLDEGSWCHGWMKSQSGSSEPPVILLGDMILSNKVVVYDLEQQVIGWADHNCSSSIKVKDDESGSDYAVQYHNLASSDSSGLLGLFNF